MTKGRPFPPGNKAGRGRPKGSRNRATLEREALLQEFSPAIIRKAVSEALKGNNTAMRLCMDKLMPSARNHATTFTLPPVRSLEDLPGASAAILKAVSAGDLSPAEAETMMGLLQVHPGFLETSLQSRIGALEQALASGGTSSRGPDLELIQLSQEQPYAQ